MGNQVDKLSHLSYAEVPTADLDPSGAGSGSGPGAGPGPGTGTGRRIGVSYIFSSDDDDEDHQQQEEEEDDDKKKKKKEEDEEPPRRHRNNNNNQEEEPYDRRDEVPCAVHNLAAGDCVYEKSVAAAGASIGVGGVVGDPEAPRSPESLLNRCRPGDLVEFVSAGQYPHWAVYVGDFQVVHLHRCEVKSALLTDAGRGRRCRVVNRRYRFEPLAPTAVVRTPWAEFKTGGEIRIGKAAVPHDGDAVRWTGRHWHSLDFQSLEDVILERTAQTGPPGPARRAGRSGRTTSTTICARWDDKSLATRG
ncbi:hypothetical protein CRUP_035929 [Coryphaenoides rupestris]|nr:hypothetical protein CRUP_035929 [Coryphaenoides rupestris]